MNEAIDDKTLRERRSKRVALNFKMKYGEDRWVRFLAMADNVEYSPTQIGAEFNVSASRIQKIYQDIFGESITEHRARMR